MGNQQGISCISRDEEGLESLDNVKTEQASKESPTCVAAQRAELAQPDAELSPGLRPLEAPEDDACRWDGLFENPTLNNAWISVAYPDFKFGRQAVETRGTCQVNNGSLCCKSYRFELTEAGDLLMLEPVRTTWTRKVALPLRAEAPAFKLGTLLAEAPVFTPGALAPAAEEAAASPASEQASEELAVSKAPTPKTAQRGGGRGDRRKWAPKAGSAKLAAGK